MFDLKIRNVENESVIKKLILGNSHYCHDDPGFEKKFVSCERKRWEGNQEPKVALITCADSRIVPHAIFQQGIGDLFELRVAGNIISESIVASLELAVMNLGVSLIIVMGHENCGAIDKAMHSPKVQNVGGHCTPTCLNRLISKIRDEIEEGEHSVEVVTKKVVHNSIEHLFELSPLIKEQYQEKRIDVLGAYYSVKSGLVEYLSY